MPTATAHFSPALFVFLRELRVNNDRAWFQTNKARYEKDVRDPALRFIEAVGPKLRKLSPHLNADPRPVGGSLFRIHRDIRFSADKSPYKTNIAMGFGHDQRSAEVHAPGLYLHIAPDESFGAGGVWAPDTPTLTRIRDAIVRDTAAWKRVTNDLSFAPMRSDYADSLKRVPTGYDPAHRFADDLRRKSHTWSVMFSEKEVCSPDFADAYVEACKPAQPFNRFMAKALGVSW